MNDSSSATIVVIAVFCYIAFLIWFTVTCRSSERCCCNDEYEEIE